MKKKIWAICLTLVLALAAFAISGCSLFNDVGTIEWLEEPAKEYSLNETETPSFKLKVHLTSTNKDITIKYPEGEHDGEIKIDNFTTKTVGTRTATVVYEKLTLSFSYKVTNGQFADGSGSPSDPYIVKTAGQFQNLLDQKTYYHYELANSIDFTGVTLKMANYGDAFKSVEEAKTGVWAGSIDGKGYSLLNLTTVVNPDGEVIAKHNELFGFVASSTQGDFTLQNITVNFKATGKGAISSLIGSNGEGGNITMKNVKFTGTMDAAYINNSNISPVISTVNDGKGAFKSIVFEDCVNSVEILNSYAVPNVAGYFNIQGGNETNEGWKAAVAKKGTVTIKNCKFNGIIESASTGVSPFVIVNSTTANSNMGWLGLYDCSIEGAKFVKTNSDPKPVIGNETALATLKSNTVSGTANTVVKGKVTITKGAGTAVTLASTVDVDEYVVFALMNVVYYRGGGGNVKARLGSFSASATLPKVIFDAETTDYTLDESLTYGSALISKNADGNLVFYVKTLNGDLSSNACTLIAVGYKDKVAVSVGKVSNIEGICEKKA